MKKLYFIEDIDPFNDTLQWKIQTKDSLIISLSPIVNLKLDVMGHQYISSSVFSDDNCAIMIFKDNFKIVNQICETIDKKLFEHCTFFSSNFIKPGFYYATNLKWYLNAVKFIFYEIQNIIKKYPETQEIIIYSKTIDKKENFSAHNIALKILVILLESSKKPELKIINVNPISKTNLKKIVGKLKTTIKQLVLSWESLLNSLSWKTKELSINSMRLFIAGQKYSIYNLSEYIKKNKLSVVFDLNEYTNWDSKKLGNDSFDAKILMVELEKTYKSIINDENFRKCFFIEEFDMWPLFEKYFRHLFTTELVTFYKEYQKASAFLKENKINAIIRQHFLNTKGAISEAARSLKIPIFTWHHGGQGGEESNPIVEYSDIRPADYWFVWGKGIEEQFRKIALRLNCKIIPVGSSQIEKSFNNAKGSKSRIPNKKSMVLCHLRGLEYPAFSDSNLTYRLDPYYKQWIELLKLYCKYIDLDFIFSVHPVNLKNIDLFKNLVDKLKIRNINFAMNFQNLMIQSELIIMDWPYTSLIYAISTDKDIICFTKGWRTSDSKKQLLSKRCAIADSISEMELLLDYYKENKKLKTDTSNMDYLLRYGIHMDSGSANERLLTEIKKIISLI